MDLSTNKRASDQAFAQLEAIVELVDKFESAKNDSDLDKAEQAIQENSLSAQVRSDWEDSSETLKAAEFNILLCTGGPDVRIIGDLSEDGEAVKVSIQHQDWGTHWQTIGMTNEQASKVLTYCRQFYFGEG